MSKKNKSLYQGVVYIILGVILLGLPSYNSSLGKKAGQLLVATPKLVQEPFKESVLLIHQYSLSSALALMINHPLDSVPDEAAEGLKDTRIPLYYGGPVDFPKRIYVLQNSGGTLLLEEITDLSAVPEMLEAKLTDLEKSMKSKSIKLLLGYAGWRPLQLTSESMKGYWDFVEVDLGLLKNTADKNLWHIVSEQGVDNSVEKSVEKQ